MNKGHMVAVDAPTIHHSRSRFDLSFDVKTSGNVGTLYPVYLQEIYPGDTFNCDATIVTRLASSYFRPVLDNLFLDMYFFFIPNRLVYSKWEEVFGENKQSAWVQLNPVDVPVSNAGETILSKTVGDYLGLPVSGDGYYLYGGLNILPFRAFAKVYDDWFRDENIIAPMLIQTGSLGTYEHFNNNDWSPSNYFGKLPSVSKFHDIFTSALPSTQKGSAASVPIVSGLAPVKANNLEGMHRIGEQVHMSLSTETDDNKNTLYNLALGTAFGSAASKYRNLVGYPEDLSGNAPYPYYWNLYADLANTGAVTVTSLRYAFQLQRILERSARTGTRYTELLLAAFGVQSPDARLQRSEYLGGKRMPLSVQQVAQNTRGDADSTQLGSLGAFSLSNGKCGYEKGFVEHGFVIGVICVRQHHTYQDGIAKFWQRHSRFDYYDPCLANISEVPVYKSELFGRHADPTANIADSGQANPTDPVFGFQEAWYDLRQRTSQITGDMRTASGTSYDIWHYGDSYANAPTLNASFITEVPDFVDRTIAVPSSSADQFIFDIYFKQSAVRVLPTYSIPGLIDHR